MSRLILVACLPLSGFLAGCTSSPQTLARDKASPAVLESPQGKATSTATPQQTQVRQDTAAVAGAVPERAYRLQQTIPVPGDGSWDLLTVDETARRVYVSHSTQVEVLDADSGNLVGTIPNTPGVHGIAVAPELGRGFISNGKADTVTVFDLKTLQHVAEVRVGKHPDAIVYEPVTRHVVAFNGGSANATFIDTATNQAMATVALGGRPEFAVADNTGQVFVVLENISQLVKLDARTPAVLQRWPLSPGQGPASLAMDRNNHRLFVGCRNKLLVVVNADNGQIVSTLPLGEKVDATAFDPQTGLVFSSNGEGTVTVVHQDGPDQYVVVNTVPTRLGSKTLALDATTHRVFVPAVQWQGNSAATTAAQPRPDAVPGSFSVLVYSP
jgi:YVTN family beta-propeller protein